MIPSGTVLLGIDGGGSSCRAAAVAGGVRYEVTLGPANVTTGFDGAVATIVRALGMLADRSGLPSETLFRAPAHLGLAGVVDAALAERGFRPGTAPNALVIGWNAGHTAVTLPDGVNVSSGENGRGVQIGGQGAYQPQFTNHMYLPLEGG